VRLCRNYLNFYQASEITDPIRALSAFPDIDDIKCEIGKLESGLTAPNFWNESFLAKEIRDKLYTLKQQLSSIEN
jgi:hypothetical protein